MKDNRKYSAFISSTYEDLREERLALMGVALESDFIPVGMEQFHAAPASQWDVIQKMIDTCDFYLLIIGGRYGSIDEKTNQSYTEKEYMYAKSRGLPVLVFIKDSSVITENQKDSGDDKYEKMKRLDIFRAKVQNDGNTVDYFKDLNGLKYAASASLGKAPDYADQNAGWIRYSDVSKLVCQGVNHITPSTNAGQSSVEKSTMLNIIDQLNGRISNLENTQLTWEPIPAKRVEDLPIEGLVNNKPVSTKDSIGDIPINAAFLLVYAADGDGRILKIQTLSSPLQLTASGKQFTAGCTKRELASWVEALDLLIEDRLVKAVGTKDEIFELTGTGYQKASVLKDSLGIDTSNAPLDELKKYNM